MTTLEVCNQQNTFADDNFKGNSQYMPMNLSSKLDTKAYQ